SPGLSARSGKRQASWMAAGFLPCPGAVTPGPAQTGRALMENIGFPLEPGQQGAEVAALQMALQLLLDRGKVLDDDPVTRQALSLALVREMSTQTFGGATSRLLILLQKERGLDATGRVDEKTAMALNALLRQEGLLSDEPQSPAAPTRGTNLPP